MTRWKVFVHDFFLTLFVNAFWIILTGAFMLPNLFVMYLSEHFGEYPPLLTIFRIFGIGLIVCASAIVAYKDTVFQAEKEQLSTAPAHTTHLIQDTSKDARNGTGYISAPEPLTLSAQPTPAASKGHFLKGYAIILTVLLLIAGYSLALKQSEWQHEFDRANEATQENSDLKISLEIAADDLQQMEAKRDDLQQYNTTLQNDRMLISEELEYYRRNAVFVTPSGERYHQATCFHIRNRSYRIYNVEAAEGLGYTACAHCW